ncbi:DUF4177 domain-containing protein [Niallia sp. XMNu-256]|uniref:DUF4177 domain-containing protein n=1 Tax=Niallia sp. XMNu-256 TaxID=3082444 RepID=UPI0030D5E4A8
MKEYQFIKINLKGIKGVSTKPAEDYKEIINKYAKDGWELVQIFSPSGSLYGSASYYEIIFSRDIK